MVELTGMVLALIALQAWTLWELAKAREKLARTERVLAKVTAFVESEMGIFE